MRKLQNNYTTPEQAKRLLELGLPEDTADCYFHENRRKELSRIFHCGDQTYSEQLTTAFTYEIAPNMRPCWSAGRLIEIYEICSGKIFTRLDVYGVFADIYTTIVDAFLNHRLDLSKLEE